MVYQLIPREKLIIRFLILVAGLVFFLSVISIILLLVLGENFMETAYSWFGVSFFFIFFFFVIGFLVMAIPRDKVFLCIDEKGIELKKKDRTIKVFSKSDIERVFISARMMMGVLAFGGLVPQLQVNIKPKNGGIESYLIDYEEVNRLSAFLKDCGILSDEGNFVGAKSWYRGWEKFNAGLIVLSAVFLVGLIVYLTVLSMQ